MNASQATVLGSLLLILGLAALAFGGYEIYNAYQYNQELGSLNEITGGLLSELPDWAQPGEQGYLVPSVIAGGGVLVAIAGWLMLAKGK